MSILKRWGQTEIKWLEMGLGLLLFVCRPAIAQSVEYIHTDALGTPVAVTDADRNVLETSEYEPFGKLLNRPLTDEPGYTGHVSDAATGMSYMEQRYYDPAIGRFLSVDPIAADGNSGAKFNRYAYVNNNPYKFVDPDGREVSLAIQRDTYSKNSVTSILTVTSDKTSLTFKGFTLEDSRGGRQRDKAPLKPGTYSASIRTDGKKGWRLELKETENYQNVQVHAGNTATDVEGCFAAGSSRAEDSVGGSKAAMNQIQAIVKADGSGQIKVNVQGASTAPKSQVTQASDKSKESE